MADLVPAELTTIAVADIDESFDCSAVYFLFDGPTVVYVGQTWSALKRIGEHLSDGRKRFDRVAFLPCEQTNRLWLEALYIDHFKPRYNAKDLAWKPLGKRARRSRRRKAREALAA